MVSSFQLSREIILVESGLIFSEATCCELKRRGSRKVQFLDSLVGKISKAQLLKPNNKLAMFLIGYLLPKIFSIMFK